MLWLPEGETGEVKRLHTFRVALNYAGVTLYAATRRIPFPWVLLGFRASGQWRTGDFDIMFSARVTGDLQSSAADAWAGGVSCLRGFNATEPMIIIERAQMEYGPYWIEYNDISLRGLVELTSAIATFRGDVNIEWLVGELPRER